jgi:hypothetical protein
LAFPQIQGYRYTLTSSEAASRFTHEEILFVESVFEDFFLPVRCTQTGSSNASGPLYMVKGTRRIQAWLSQYKKKFSSCQNALEHALEPTSAFSLHPLFRPFSFFAFPFSPYLDTVKKYIFRP